MSGDEKAAKAQILARGQSATDAYTAGDMDRFMEHYTETMTLMLNDCKPVVGKKNAREFLVTFMKDTAKVVHEKVEYFKLMSDNKACTNECFALYDANGKLTTNIHDFFLWKKINGEWYIDREICNTRSVTKDDPRKQIEARIQQLYTAFNNDDYDGAVSIYTEDATVVPHEGVVTTGKQAIKEMFMGVIPGMKTLTVEELYYFELLNETTAYTNSHMKAVGDDGTVKAVFRDCLIWTNKDGQWYIERDFFNDRPAN